MGRVAAADVARLAGVSGQTVSRVVNGSTRVDPATRSRVEAAMVELGYRPNRTARALRTGRTRTIGVVVRTLATVGNARMLQAIAEASAEREHSVLVMTLGDDADAAVVAFEDLRDQGVDGAVVLNEATPVIREAPAPAGLPLVVVDSAPRPGLPVVEADHAGGARVATQHLLDLGHRTVHHVGGPIGSYAAMERERGWREALERAGVVAPEIVHGDWTARTGYEAGRALVGSGDVTAVFAANDQTALGLLRAAHEAGRGDLAVVGFDDLVDAAEYWPPLTTVAQDFDVLGHSAVRTLLAIVEGEEAPARLVVPTRLVVRESSRASVR